MGMTKMGKKHEHIHIYKYGAKNIKLGLKVLLKVETWIETERQTEKK
jgi:hypothetical protein